MTHAAGNSAPGSGPARTPPPANCPCLSGEQYVDCCGRFHRNEAEAPTAEQLMRSRYSAFAVLDAGYLLRTWHPDTRPANLEFDPGVLWRRLDIVSIRGGGPLDSAGTVEFAAHFRHGGEKGIQRETSRFVRVERRWYYLDAVPPA